MFTLMLNRWEQDTHFISSNRISDLKKYIKHCDEIGQLNYLQAFVWFNTFNFKLVEQVPTS